MKSNYDLMKNSKQESLNNNFQILKSMLDNSSTQRWVAALLGKYLLTLGRSARPMAQCNIPEDLKL
jgi:Trp operon repressor